MTDHMQIEDTPEFAAYEASLPDSGASPPEPSVWSWGGRGGFAGGFPKDRGPDPAPATAAPAIIWPDDHDEFGDSERAAEARRNQDRPVDLDGADNRENCCYAVPAEYDDAWESKTPLLSEAQWALVCAQLGIDPSYPF